MPQITSRFPGGIEAGNRIERLMPSGDVRRRLVASARHCLEYAEMFLDEAILTHLDRLRKRLDGSGGPEFRRGMWLKACAEGFYFESARAVGLLSQVFGSYCLNRKGQALGAVLVRNAFIEHPADEHRSEFWATECPEIVVQARARGRD
jgi:hypothetical protein